MGIVLWMAVLGCSDPGSEGAGQVAPAPDAGVVDAGVVEAVNGAVNEPVAVRKGRRLQRIRRQPRDGAQAIANQRVDVTARLEEANQAVKDARRVFAGDDALQKRLDELDAVVQKARRELGDDVSVSDPVPEAVLDELDKAEAEIRALLQVARERSEAESGG